MEIMTERRGSTLLESTLGSLDMMQEPSMTVHMLVGCFSPVSLHHMLSCFPGLMFVLQMQKSSYDSEEQIAFGYPQTAGAVGKSKSFPQQNALARRSKDNLLTWCHHLEKTI